MFSQRKQLLDELARTPAIEAETDTETQDIEAFDPETYRKSIAEFEAVEEELQRARTEAGRQEERISALGRSEERSHARIRQESILAGIDEASGE